MIRCKRCKQAKAVTEFWYKDRDVCTSCLLHNQVSSSNARARGYKQLDRLEYHHWLMMLAMHNHSCALCGNGNHFYPLEIDHIIPLSKGGTHKISNLRPACNKCNISRGNGDRGGKRKSLSEFPCTCRFEGQPIALHHAKCVLHLAVKRRTVHEKEKMIGTQEAATILKVTPRRIRALIKSGKLHAEKFGRDWLIQPIDLAAIYSRPSGRPKNPK